MSFLSRLFGGGAAPKMSDEAVVSRLHRGLRVDLSEVKRERKDDPESYTDLLWRLATDEALSDPSPYVEALCDEPLSGDDLQDLLTAAATRPDRLPWMALDVLRKAEPWSWLNDKPDSRDDVAAALGCLAESAVNGGPAGDLFDLDEAPALLSVVVAEVQRDGASVHELAALPWLARVAQQAAEDPDLDDWDDSLAQSLVAAVKEAREGAPRGEEGPWETVLQGQVFKADAEQSLAALTAARACDIDVKSALQQRVVEVGDDAAWSLGALCLDWPEILRAMSDAGVDRLQGRRMREGELCSLSSQAGCQSCGSGPGAPDDELMVPQALEQKLVPVLQAATAAPLDHEALLVESIAAPSITLRFYGLNALLQAEPDALGDETWEVIEALKGDSHPQVQQLVIALMERKTA